MHFVLRSIQKTTKTTMYINHKNKKKNTIWHFGVNLTRANAVVYAAGSVRSSVSRRTGPVPQPVRPPPPLPPPRFPTNAVWHMSTPSVGALVGALSGLALGPAGAFVTSPYLQMSRLRELIKRRAQKCADYITRNRRRRVCPWFVAESLSQNTSRFFQFYGDGRVPACSTVIWRLTEFQVSKKSSYWKIGTSFNR